MCDSDLEEVREISTRYMKNIFGSLRKEDKINTEKNVMILLDMSLLLFDLSLKYIVEQNIPIENLRELKEIMDENSSRRFQQAEVALKQKMN